MSNSNRPNEYSRAEKGGRFAIGGIPISAIALLLLTAIISLLWSRYAAITTDESLELWTDRVSSFGQLIHIQRTYPVVIDPLAYHAIVYTTIRIFGAGALALRLPALLGVLLMQICLFIFVRRVSTERAALFALGLPALTGAMTYSIEGRPYGLLLGLFGLVMVSWQAAARRESNRSIPLITLALGIALALNTHYFGMLVLAPLCIAELVRSVHRRRLDLPVLLSIILGTAGIIFTLPFMKGALEFRTKHYDAHLNTLSPKVIGWAYLWVISKHTYIHQGKIINMALLAVLIAVIGFSLWAFAYQWRKKALRLTQAEVVFLVSLAALPVFGYILASFTSHVMETRYVFGLIIGIAALTALGLFSFFPGERAERSILIALCVMIVFTGTADVYLQRIAERKTQLSMILNPEIRARLMATPSQSIYMEDMENYGIATFYEPDPYVRSHIVLVYSDNEETKWEQTDIFARIARHMNQFSQMPTITYESLKMQPGEHLVVDFNRGGGWLGKALAADHADVSPLGPAFGGGDVMGTIEAVQFQP